MPKCSECRSGYESNTYKAVMEHSNADPLYFCGRTGGHNHNVYCRSNYEHPCSYFEPKEKRCPTCGQVVKDA